MEAQLTSQPEGGQSNFDDILDRIELASDFDDLVTARDWIVPGLIAFGEVTAVYGKPGSLKSVFAAGMAFYIATGRDWHGESGGYLRNVLYVAAERSQSIKRRILALAHHAGVRTPGNLAVYSGPIDLCADGALRRVIAATEAKLGEEVDAVFIDTLQAAMSRPTSDTTATSAAMHELAAAADLYTSPAIIFVHHTPQSGEDRMSGGHFEAGADIVARARKTGDDSGSLTVTKDNGSSSEEWTKWSYRAIGVTVPHRFESFNEPVLVPLSAAEAAEPAPRLSGRAAAALEALESVSTDGPAHLDDWRAEFYRTMPSAKTTAQRQAFNRAKSGLLAAELILETAPDHFQARDMSVTNEEQFDA